MENSVAASGSSDPGWNAGWNPSTNDRCARSYCVDVRDVVRHPGAPWEKCCVQIGGLQVDPESPIYHEDEWVQLRRVLQDQIRILKLKEDISGNSLVIKVVNLDQLNLTCFNFNIVLRS